jgi:hypothetical protein
MKDRLAPDEDAIDAHTPAVNKALPLAPADRCSAGSKNASASSK